MPLPRINAFLKLNLAATTVIGVAWTVQNVRLALYHRGSANPLSELGDEVDLTLLIFVCLFSFAPQIFSLCLCFLFTGLAEYREGALMARASAFAACWVFGPLAWMILDAGQVIQGLSRSPRSMRESLCGPSGDDQWCSFLETSARLSIALCVPQTLLLLYNGSLYFRSLCGRRAAARPPLEPFQRAALAVVLLFGAGYAAWAVASLGTYSLLTTSVDFVRLLVTPFLAISVFLTCVFGTMLVYEPSEEMNVLVFGFAGLGVFGFSGGIAYHWRRLRDEDYALLGVTPCRELNPVVDILKGVLKVYDSAHLCAWEEAIVVGLSACLAAHALMAVVTGYQMCKRRTKWRRLTFGGDEQALYQALRAEASDGGGDNGRPLLAPTAEGGAGDDVPIYY